MKRGSAALLLSLLILTGCPTLPRFTPATPPLSQSEGASLCQQITSGNHLPQQLRSLIEAEFHHGSDAYSFRYVIVAKSPDKLRVDILPLEGAFTLGMLVIADGHAVALDAQAKTYSESDNPEAVLARVLGIGGLTRETLLALVSGTLPELDCSRARVYTDGPSVLLLDTVTGSVWQIGSQVGELRKVQILDHDRERIALEATPGAPTESSSVVHLEIFDPVRASGVLDIKRIPVRSEISDTLFEAKIPGNYTRDE